MPIPVPNVRTIRIPKGDAGTFQTVRLMSQLIRKGSKLPSIRSMAVSIAMQHPNDFEKAKALFSFVRSRMNYVRDNLYNETLSDPDYQIRCFVESGYAAGDCDDHTIFLGSLLTSIGIPVRIVTVRVAPGFGPFDHVYLEALIRGSWIPMDATNKSKNFGWMVPKPSRIRKFSV